MLFYAWKATGADPYRLYNGLDADYRPFGHPEVEPRPPAFPDRVRNFIYACALYARELERKDAGELAAAIGKAVGG